MSIVTAVRATARARGLISREFCPRSQQTKLIQWSSGGLRKGRNSRGYRRDGRARTPPGAVLGSVACSSAVAGAFRLCQIGLFYSLPVCSHVPCSIPGPNNFFMFFFGYVFYLSLPINTFSSAFITRLVLNRNNAQLVCSFHACFLQASTIVPSFEIHSL